jgi:hypothetical protein
LEGSSGQNKANVNRIVDDSLKQLSSLMTMRKDIANSHLNASFTTFLVIKVFGIQSVKTNIVLFVVQFNDEGRFIYHEVSAADIPTKFTQRNKWLKVFEIICYLFIGLKEQEVNYRAPEDEEQGAIVVLPQHAVRAKLHENSSNCSLH